MVIRIVVSPDDKSNHFILENKDSSVQGGH